jgi:signal transduction histidine kinase
MSTVSKAMADGNPFVMEFRAVHPDGTIVPILGRGRCDVDESGRIVRMSGTCQDITDQKCSEAALFEAKRIAEAAAAAKAAFLAQMSHEIRTPMNGIQGLSELLSDTPLDTKQKDYLLSIRRTADHLLSIINHILDFSKLEAGKVTLSCAPFDLESAMAQLGRMIMPLMEETCLSFQVVVGPDCPKVLTGDQTRLNQILLNLLSNAAKFTPAGGTVRFEVHPCAPPGEGTDGAGLLLPCLNGVF